MYETPKYNLLMLKLPSIPIPWLGSFTWFRDRTTLYVRGVIFNQSAIYTAKVYPKDLFFRRLPNGCARQFLLIF